MRISRFCSPWETVGLGSDRPGFDASTAYSSYLYASPMYSRYRRNNNFFQAFFWVLVGFLAGQVVRLDIALLPRASTPQSTQNTVYQPY